MRYALVISLFSVSLSAAIIEVHNNSKESVDVTLVTFRQTFKSPKKKQAETGKSGVGGTGNPLDERTYTLKPGDYVGGAAKYRLFVKKGDIKKHIELQDLKADDQKYIFYTDDVLKNTVPLFTVVDDGPAKMVPHLVTYE